MSFWLITFLLIILTYSTLALHEVVEPLKADYEGDILGDFSKDDKKIFSKDVIIKCPASPPETEIEFSSYFFWHLESSDSTGYFYLPKFNLPVFTTVYLYENNNGTANFSSPNVSDILLGKGTMVNFSQIIIHKSEYKFDTSKRTLKEQGYINSVLYLTKNSSFINLTSMNGDPLELWLYVRRISSDSQIEIFFENPTQVNVTNETGFQVFFNTTHIQIINFEEFSATVDVNGKFSYKLFALPSVFAGEYATHKVEFIDPSFKFHIDSGNISTEEGKGPEVYDVDLNISKAKSVTFLFDRSLVKPTHAKLEFTINTGYLNTTINNSTKSYASDVKLQLRWGWDWEGLGGYGKEIRDITRILCATGIGAVVSYVASKRSIEKKIESLFRELRVMLRKSSVESLRISMREKIKIKL